MLSREEYKKLTDKHNKACEKSDYSNMIMVGDNEYKKIKEYEAKRCEHKNTTSIQGGTIDICLDCGKRWG